MQDSHSTGNMPASRRRFFAGAASVGAVAAAVAVLPRVVDAPIPEVQAAPTLPPAPANGGGYSLSEHVKHYYRTAAA
ncbi:MAG: formate dehydrogenase [Comamonadaceae bacterium]|nr:MAG: formate dehydrogenase [Comamonadaceae bacterium]